MRVLVIGGTRFVGVLLVYRLIARGDEVTIFNRGTLPDSFGNRVTRLRGDRRTSEFATALAGREFDAVVDFAAYDGVDAQGVIDVLGQRAGHYVMVSTGQVYLVREGCPTPAKESDYLGPVMAMPREVEDIDSWKYGVEKREAEDALVSAFDSGKLTSTRVRIPMVNGEADYLRRIDGYLMRMLDGGPVLIPDGGTAIARHVYGLDVAIGIADILGKETTFGQAWNLCQDETPSVWDVVGMLIERLGAHDRRVPIARSALGTLVAREVSPFSGRWMSLLDPTRARTELGFRHRPLGNYLDSIVASFLSNTGRSALPPPGYERRAEELALARTLDTLA